MKNYIIPIILVIIIILLLLFIPKHTKPLTNTVTVTDTVYVDRIKTIVVEKDKVTPPNTLKIQKTTNKALRDTLEDKPIITAVKATASLLTVQTIDTSGVISQAEYKLEGANELTIDSSASVEVKPDVKAIKKEKRKKVLRKIATVTVGVLAFILGSMI